MPRFTRKQKRKQNQRGGSNSNYGKPTIENVLGFTANVGYGAEVIPRASVLSTRTRTNYNLGFLRKKAINAAKASGKRLEKEIKNILYYTKQLNSELTTPDPWGYGNKLIPEYEQKIKIGLGNIRSLLAKGSGVSVNSLVLLFQLPIGKILYICTEHSKIRIEAYKKAKDVMEGLEDILRNAEDNIHAAQIEFRSPINNNNVGGYGYVPTSTRNEYAMIRNAIDKFNWFLQSYTPSSNTFVGIPVRKNIDSLRTYDNDPIYDFNEDIMHHQNNNFQNNNFQNNNFQNNNFQNNNFQNNNNQNNNYGNAMRALYGNNNE